MATPTTDAPPKAKATMLDRIGAGGSVLSVLALAVPVGYTVYANSNPVTLNTSDDVKSLITNGIIITVAAGAIGLIATVLNVPGLLKNLSVGRIAATGVSALMLIASVLFLVLGLLPRVTPLNHLSNDLQPFGNSLTTNCATPLNKLTTDEHRVWVDANVTLSQAGVGDANADSNFAKFMQADAALLTTDSSALSAGASALGSVKAPDAKYNDLLTRCITDLKGDADFLTNDTGQNAVKLAALLQANPQTAPLAAILPMPTFSLISLVKDGAALAAHQVPGVPAGAVPSGTIEALVATIMGGNAAAGVPASQAVLCAKDPQLTSDANQLYNDAVNILTTNTTPFKANVDAIIGTNAPSPNYCSAG